MNSTNKSNLEFNRINTIHYSDTDLNYLQFLIELLKDERIVILGEPSHRDGKVFTAKSELIKYFYKKLNFDVLVFDCGFIMCNNKCKILTTDEVL